MCGWGLTEATSQISRAHRTEMSEWTDMVGTFSWTYNGDAFDIYKTGTFKTCGRLCLYLSKSQHISCSQKIEMSNFPMSIHGQVRLLGSLLHGTEQPAFAGCPFSQSTLSLGHPLWLCILNMSMLRLFIWMLSVHFSCFFSVEGKTSTDDILFNGTNNTQALYFSIILYGPHENPFRRGGRGYAVEAEEDEEETRSTGVSFSFEKLYKLHRFGLSLSLCLTL